MAIIASDNGGGGDFKQIPQGTHIAICNMVVDLGKQKVDWQGQTKIQHKIYIRWELPHERLQWTDRDGNEREGPMVANKIYTCSLNERAALRGDLEAWRGRAFTPEELEAFDVGKLLGAPCAITVTHTEKNGKTYANVTGIAGIPKGMDRPTKTENPMIIFDDEHPDAYNDLPEWLQKKIDEQVKEQPPVKADYSDLDDDVPF